MPFLDAHRRRVPAQDIDCSVVIGMGAKAAMLTDKDRLAFTALPVYGSASRTGSRGIGGIDPAQVSAMLFDFVGKDGLEAEPALIENAPVQSGLLADHATRLVNCAFGRSRHVPDFQVFKNDRAEAPGQIERCPMLPVAADAGTSRGQFGGTAQRLGPADGAALATARKAMCGTLASLDGLKRARHGQALAIGQGKRIGDAAINADGRADIGRNDMRDLAGKRDMPAKRVQGHGCVLDRAAQGPRVAELHPADLGQTHGGISAIELLDLNLAALKTERVVYGLAARRGIAGSALEEVGICLVEVAQRLLLACLRYGSNPVVLRPQDGQFPCLRHVIESPSGLTLIVPPEIAALLKSQIVDQAAHAGELPEQDFLLGRWTQLEAEAAKDHSANLAVGLTRRKMAENADIRKGRHVVCALHAHLVFVTKHRRDALSELAIRDLRTIFAKVCKDFEAERIECNGEDDHVHLLIVYPPKVALSKLVNSLKGVSSRLLREWRPEVRGRYKDGVLWSPSYFVASCGGAPPTVVAEYVKSQREATSGRSRLPPRPEGQGFSRGSR